VTTLSLAVRLAVLAAALAPALAHASEASLVLPDLNSVKFVGFGGATLLAVLGVVTFPSRVIEIGIAASVFVLAVELTRTEGTTSTLLR
jgi:hypothetical protein